MVDNILWVQNPGPNDVLLGDLGVKILAGRTANIYKANPRLTVAQVDLSMKLGSLRKRLDTKVLKIVHNHTTVRPVVLDQLKATKTPIMARKTKTSVVIEPEQLDEEGKKSFNFADYGVVDAEPITRPEKMAEGVVIQPKEDEPTENKAASNQSKTVMENLQKSFTNPIGPVVDTFSPTNSQAVIVKAQKKEIIPAVKLNIRVEEKLAVEKPKVLASAPKARKTKKGAVVVGDGEKVRSLKAIKEGKEDSDKITDDDVAGADKIIKLELDEVVKVLIKDEEGAIIVAAEEEKK